jgi:hypothetical protein
VRQCSPFVIHRGWPLSEKPGRGFAFDSSQSRGWNTVPTTAREIAEALITDRAKRKHADLQAAILVALRKRNGGMAVGEGARWRLKEPPTETVPTTT